MDLGAVNKKTIESLIKAGAMDLLGKRTSLLINYPQIIDKLNKRKKKENEGQGSLFEEDLEAKEFETEIEDSNVEDFSSKEKLNFEKEFLGFYLTSHPMLSELMSIKSKITHEMGLVIEEPEGVRVRIGGIVEHTRRIFTKKSGSEMAFVTIGDEKGIVVECVIFPKVFEQYKSYIQKDTVIIVEGKVDTKNERPVIIAEKIVTVGNFAS